MHPLPIIKRHWIEKLCDFVTQVAAAPGLPMRTRLLVLLTASDILKCAPCYFYIICVCSHFLSAPKCACP